MFGILKSGGIIMIPIILCGIIATYIIIERCIYFYTTKKKDKNLIKYKSLNGILENNIKK